MYLLAVVLALQYLRWFLHRFLPMVGFLVPHGKLSGSLLEKLHEENLLPFTTVFQSHNNKQWHKLLILT